MENPNPHQIAQMQLDRDTDKLDIEFWMGELLKTLNREVTINLPVKMGDGAVKVFTGYNLDTITLEVFTEVAWPTEFRKLFEKSGMVQKYDER